MNFNLRHTFWRSRDDLFLPPQAPHSQAPLFLTRHNVFCALLHCPSCRFCAAVPLLSPTPGPHLGNCIRFIIIFGYIECSVLIVHVNNMIVCAKIN